MCSSRRMTKRTGECSSTSFPKFLTRSLLFQASDSYSTSTSKCHDHVHRFGQTGNEYIDMTLVESFDMLSARSHRPLALVGVQPQWGQSMRNDISSFFYLHVEFRWSDLVRSLKVSQRPKTRPGGPVWSWDAAETGPPQDQDRSLVPVFVRSWSDQINDEVNGRLYRGP
jgi:hypothetical protein